MVSHQIQRGLSRVSMKRKKATTELEKANLRQRDLVQILKEKEFELQCIQLLLSKNITEEVRVVYRVHQMPALL